MTFELNLRSRVQEASQDLATDSVWHVHWPLIERKLHNEVRPPMEALDAMGKRWGFILLVSVSQGEVKEPGELTAWRKQVLPVRSRGKVSLHNWGDGFLSTEM
jgi:hypothetical protein